MLGEFILLITTEFLNNMKIKVWDTKNHEWIRSLDFINHLVKTTKSNNVELTIGSEEEDYKVCLFTGAKDKNGKSVYEGDIVKYIINGQLSNPNQIIGEVYYQDGDLYPRIEKSHVLGGNCEILGNIFENPELLNK